MNGLNSKMKLEERICEIEDRAIEIIQYEEHRKRLKIIRPL